MPTTTDKAGIRAPSATFLLLALAALTCACEKPSATNTFVVFTERTLFIDHFESPTPIPITAGSSPSPQTMVSSEPQTVSIAPDGRLVGHRNGVSIVSSISDSKIAIQVEVRQVGQLRLEPALVLLSPQASLAIHVMSDESEVSPSAVKWSTSSPSIAIPAGGFIRATGEMGKARVFAEYGGATAEGVVEVRAEKTKGRTNVNHAGVAP